MGALWESEGLRSFILPFGDCITPDRIPRAHVSAPPYSMHICTHFNTPLYFLLSNTATSSLALLLHLVGSILGGGTRRPDSLDSLGQTNVVGLKLIPAPSDNEYSDHVEEVGDLAGLGYPPFGEVIGDGGS